MNETLLQYPIGRFTVDQLEKETSAATRRQRIRALARTPDLLAKAVSGLSDEQLDTRYRPGGWTIRQLVHHIADSHLQAYAIFKTTLTADKPLLRMYDSAAWGEFQDARESPVAVSLSLLSAVHARWDVLLSSMNPGDFSRAFDRPEWGGLITLDNLLQMLDWHLCHHLAHINGVRDRSDW